MKNLIIFALVAFGLAHAFAQSSTMTYQGLLKDGGAPANGAYNMRFRLCSAASGAGTVLQTFPTAGTVAVNTANGLFTQELTFDTAHFNGSDRWLEIEVNGTTLAPRVKMNPTPYAVRANNAGSVPWSGVTGAPTSFPPSGAAGGDLTGTYPNPTIANNAVTTAKINGNAVTNTKLASDALSLNKVSGGVLTSSGGNILLNNDTASITFPAASGSNSPMIQMFASGTANADRMVIAHSPSFLNWGMQYRDSDDKFNFMGGGLTAMSIDLANLRVGVGTFVPEVPLHVNLGSDTEPGSGGYFQIGLTTGTNLSMDNNEIMARNNGAVSTLFLNADGGNVTLVQSGTGNVGIGTSSPATKLHVNGTARVDVLEITGADLAEKFPVSEEVKPGMVVAIDADKKGQLCLARGAYNRKVAGVVSGANDLSVGVVLGHYPGNEHGIPIAMSGRVWVYCDATKHAVKVGDLLTTSDTPGYAMVVRDYKKAQGAIIGKAMTSLDQGETGMVLVLVNLQ